MKKILILVFILLIGLGCKGKEEKVNMENSDNEITKEVAAEEETSKDIAAPTQSNVDPTKKYFAQIKTSKGLIKVALDPKAAPLSVTNFSMLASKGFYNGLTFHRVVPDFVIQGGDPTGTGRGGPGYTIPAEIGLKHDKGAIAWARLPDSANPKKDSSGSQFYIALDELPSLDGDYTVFGQTISGMEVVEKIERGDKIESVIVEVE